MFIHTHTHIVHISTEGYQSNFTSVLLHCSRGSINITRTCQNIRFYVYCLISYMLILLNVWCFHLLFCIETL